MKNILEERKDHIKVELEKAKEIELLRAEISEKFTLSDDELLDLFAEKYKENLVKDGKIKYYPLGAGFNPDFNGVTQKELTKCGRGTYGSFETDHFVSDYGKLIRIENITITKESEQRLFKLLQGLGMTVEIDEANKSTYIKIEEVKGYLEDEEADKKYNDLLLKKHTLKKTEPNHNDGYDFSITCENGECYKGLYQHDNNDVAILIRKMSIKEDK